MRNGLIELLREAKEHPEKTCPKYELPTCFGCEYNKGDECDRIARLADYLLKNGVIVPPCKVGDKVWAISLSGRLYEYTVNGIHQFEDKHLMFGGYRIREDGKKITPTWQDNEIGKIVFVGDNAKEEAEKVLKEGFDNVQS